MTTVSAELASDTTPAAQGFDFLHGRWDVRHRKLRKRLAGCQDWFEFPGVLNVFPILSGNGNFDYNGLEDPDGAYVAHSLRLFDPAKEEWTIYWLDSRHPGAGIGVPVVGRFHGRKAMLFGDDMLAERPIKVRTTYEPMDEQNAQWTQAFRFRDTDPWEVNWVMDFSRNSIEQALSLR